MESKHVKNPFTAGEHAGSRWSLEVHFSGEGLRQRTFMLIETEANGARRPRRLFDSLGAVKQFAREHAIKLESIKD